MTWMESKLIGVKMTMIKQMFAELEKINQRPKPFEFYTASELWTNEHTSKQMLNYHLDGNVDISSRNSTFIEQSVDWMVSRFNVGKGTTIADFGCGPGLYSKKLAQRQATVTGIDFSPRSVEYARDTAQKEGLNINYVNQNYLEFESDDRFDLIIMIMCDFCALSPVQRNSILSTFRTLLKPGGHVLLDVYTLHAFQQREETAMYQVNLLNGFWSPDKYYGFLNTFKYEEEKVILDKYTILEAGGIKTVYNWLQHFDPEMLKAEFSASGLSIENFYSDVAGSLYDPNANKSEMAVVARKTK